MDKTKVRIDLTEAWRALDRLEAALDQGDQRQAGAQLLRLRQALENLQTSTGVKLEFVNLKPEADRCNVCGGTGYISGSTICDMCNGSGITPQD